MPEILPDHVPSPRTMLVWDGTRYRAVRGYTDGTVQVRGEDQLHSFLGVLAQSRQAANTGADGTADSDPGAAGEIWHVTAISARDRDGATTDHIYSLIHDGTAYEFHSIAAAYAAWDSSYWSGHLWLDEGDTIRVGMVGAGAGDRYIVQLLGEIMTLEV